MGLEITGLEERIRRFPSGAGRRSDSASAPLHGRRRGALVIVAPVEQGQMIVGAQPGPGPGQARSEPGQG